MEKILIASLVSLFAAAGAHAAAATDGSVTMNTDPAKAAAVEREAQTLKAQSEKAGNPSGASASKKATKHTRRHQHHASHKAVAKTPSAG
jgi:hypothetical protein